MRQGSWCFLMRPGCPWSVCLGPWPWGMPGGGPQASILSPNAWKAPASCRGPPKSPDVSSLPSAWTPFASEKDDSVLPFPPPHLLSCLSVRSLTGSFLNSLCTQLVWQGPSRPLWALRRLSLGLFWGECAHWSHVPDVQVSTYEQSHQDEDYLLVSCNHSNYNPFVGKYYFFSISLFKY